MELNLTREHKEVFKWLASQTLRIKNSFNLQEIAEGVGISDEDRVFKILKELYELTGNRVFTRETLIFSMGYSGGEPKFVISEDAQHAWKEYQKAEKKAGVCPECAEPGLEIKLWCPHCRKMFDA